MKFISWDYNLFQPTASDGVHLHIESNQLTMQTGSNNEYISVNYASSSYNRGNSYWSINTPPAEYTSHPTITSGSLTTYTESSLSGNQNIIHIEVGSVKTMFLSSSTDTLQAYTYDGEGTWSQVDKKPHEVTTDCAFIKLSEDNSDSSLTMVTSVSQSVQPDTNVKEWTIELNGANTDSGIFVNKIAW